MIDISGSVIQNHVMSKIFQNVKVLPILKYFRTGKQMTLSAR